MGLRIPERDRDKFAALLKLSAEARNKLYEALRVSQPRLQLSQLARDIKEDVKIPSPILEDVLRLLMTLSSIQADRLRTPEELVADVLEAAQESDDARLK